ncbi:transposase [Xanthomonas citri pv. bilvae]|nr:transposase [Xanthomonas citri pv. bilvae]
MQLTFGDAEGLGKRKQTRREIFLAEMEQVVPWQHLLGLIAPHYPVSGRPGRQPYALATMLRIHLLQQWYALSDPAMEEALHEIPTLRRFAQLGGLDDIPDETTILNFRRLLETHGLAARMLDAVNAHLARKGQSLRSGTIVDATLIAASSSTNNADRARDPEMHQTRKGNQWYFGMKAHIGADEFSGLVHHVHCTAANVADVTVMHTLAAIPARKSATTCRTAKLPSSSPPGPRRSKPSATSASVLEKSVGNTSKPACAQKWSIRFA